MGSTMDYTLEQELKLMNLMVDTPFSTSIPIISTKLASNLTSNPSSSTNWGESQLYNDILEEVGQEQGECSMIREGVPISVDDIFQQVNNVVESPIQNVNAKL